MYQEACSIGGSACVSSNRLAIVVNKDHIGRFEKGEVSAEGVRPERMRIFGIAYADVSKYTINIQSEPGMAPVCIDSAYPDIPSVNPLRAKTRNAPAMWLRIHARSLSWDEKRGMPGKQTPCEMACKGVFSFVESSFRGTSCFVVSVDVGWTATAEGAIIGSGSER